MLQYRIPSRKRTFAFFFESLVCVTRLIVLFWLSGVGAVASASLPIPAHVLKKRFPQVEIGDCSVSMVANHPHDPVPTATLNAEGITVQPVDGSLVVSGADRNGFTWHVTFPNEPGGCSAWKADLDHNGRTDLIVATFDPNSGGKDVTLTILMIDDQGRPVPWQSRGYFDVDNKGVRELLDLNGDGSAELLVLQIEGDKFNGTRSLISLYKAKNAYWMRSAGVYGGVAFPLKKPSNGRFREEEDLSTEPVQSGPIFRVESLIRGSQDDCGVQLPVNRTVNGSAVVDSAKVGELEAKCFDRMVLSNGYTSRLPKIVVIELRETRRAAIGSVEQLAAEVRDSRLSVRLSGISCDTGCRPFMLWAFKAP